MTERRITIPVGMLEAAMSNCTKGTTVYHTCRASLEAALGWLLDDWENSPNSVRMPDPWYSRSLAKWEKFRSKWNRDGDISFVDLLNFFGNRLVERFIAPGSIQIPPSLMGRTFTRAEADAIIDVVESSVAPEPSVPPVDPRREKIKQALQRELLRETGSEQLTDVVLAALDEAQSGEPLILDSSMYRSDPLPQPAPPREPFKRQDPKP